MPRLSAEYKKRARELIIENLDRFIKRYFDDDRNLITKYNDYKRRYGVIEKENDEIKLFITVSRTTFPVCNHRDKYFEDFVATIFANVNGIDVVCRVNLKWKNNIIGGQIVSQFGEKFSIYEQQIYSGKKLRMKKYYDKNIDKLNPDIEFVDFDFYLI